MRYLFLILFALATAAAAAPDKPNLIFIMLDDLGYGDLSCYNPESKIQTPNMDALAAAGMRFTDAHSPGSVCVPARFGFLTGLYPLAKNGYNRKKPIAEGTVTVASFLREQGYRTAMVGKWHNGFWNVKGYASKNVPAKLEGGPFGLGFDSFWGIPHSLDISGYFYIENDTPVALPTEAVKPSQPSKDDHWSSVQGKFWRKGFGAPGFKHENVLPDFTDKAIEKLNEFKASEADQPFFLYWALAGPHTPWLPTEEFEGQSGAGLYGDFVMNVDAEIGRVLETLRINGQLENTMICLSSDNGPVWYDKDVAEFAHDSVGSLRGIKSGLYEGGHRMPLIVSWPGVVEAGSTSDALVNLTDMIATYSEIVRAPLPEGAGLDSESFLQVLKGESETAREFTIHPARRGMAVRQGDFKYINTSGSGGLMFANEGNKPNPDGPPAQLYDLSQDIGETRNLFGEMPEKTEAMAELLDKLLNISPQKTL